MTPKPPPVDNFLRLYTDLATRPNDYVMELEEFAGLGPKTTITELTKMWVELHLGIEWTIVTIDPLGFTDTITAKSRNTTKVQRIGNHLGWDPLKQSDFVRAIRNTTGTLLIVEGLREQVPVWHLEFDRTCVVNPPSTVRMGSD